MSSLLEKIASLIQRLSKIRVMMLKALSTIFQLYRGSHLNWWNKSEYLKRTINLPKVTDKLYHIKAA
jgi:hypothetical protein